MSCAELQTVLDRHGIRRDSYSLTGGCPNESYCIERCAGGWAVYYSERGKRNDERWFASESEACDHLAELLIDDPTARER
jgi:hypothetical protein